MLLSPCLNPGGKAVDLFSADTGFKSQLSKLLKSSELQCLHPKVVMRITKLICYKILTPCHRIDGSMCMSFLIYLIGKGWNLTHLYNSTVNMQPGT